MREKVSREAILRVARKVNPAVRMNTDLIASGIYNSLEVITLVVYLESAYHITIPPEKITEKNFNDISSITRLVRDCMKRPGHREESPPRLYHISQKRRAAPTRKTPFQYPENAANVLDFLENAVRQVPDKILMTDQYGNRFTFSEFLYRSRQIGSYIARKYGCARRPFVVLERRNIKCLAMLLGVIWSGNYYVSLDESFERDRLRAMMDIVRPEGVLWHFSANNSKILDFNPELYDDMIETEPNLPLMEKIKSSFRYDDPLYGVYTSGTTGFPKCVIKSHGAMVDFIRNYVRLFGFDHSDVIGSKLSLMFDAITKDMYSAFYCGATMHIMPRGRSLPPDDAALVSGKGVTSVVWPPSLLIHFAQLHILENISMPSLKRVLFVGEALPAKYINYWIRYRPDITYINLYGTSEMTGNCLYKIVRDPVKQDVTPLRDVFPGYDVFLLDNDDREVSGAGATGEICAGGELLCVGQLGQPMDPEKFIKNPLPNPKSERVYRSGDIVRVSPEGDLIFLSRKDYRFKHAGYRIDPGEIEELFNRLEFMEIAVCLYDALNQRIILFWQGDQSRENEVYDFANGNLPPHMLPGKYVFLSEFPRNNNGKVDKAHLVRWIEATKGECDGNV